MAEKELLEEWFYQYSDELYNYLMYFTNLSEVDDLVQETFIKAMRGMKSYKREASPRTWLYRIARNVAIDYLRKSKRVKAREVLTDEESKSVSDVTPDKIFQLEETKKELYKAILSLKETYRDVLILRAIKEFNIAETAAILNWSENKVRVSFHRALKALEKEVAHLE
jgi:RNA polymerase sigma-70 factor, ECF subfamily